MPALLIYLLKVNVALLLFCLGYYTVLRRLTFYTLNRVYLILAIVFCSLYPAINFTGVVQNHQQLAKPLQVIIIDWGNRAQSISMPVTQTNYWQYIVILFWVGVVLMTIRLIIQFFSLYNLYRRSKPGLVNHQQVRLMNHDSNPFSFWQHIYINPELHSETELSSIIAHEQVHVKQWHTLDVLLAELSLIFYWFNPGVWMMKKAISENLEFITDRKVLQEGTDAKSYQYSLLYTCVNTSSNAVVNHFNISTIKKRIIMMNSKKSAAYNISRYTFVVPAVIVLLLAFGTSKAALIHTGVNAVKKASQQAITMMDFVNVNAKTDTTKKTIPASNNADLRKDTAIIQPDVPISIKPDKPNFLDSVNYYIDGKLADVKKFKSLDRNDILTYDLEGPKVAGITNGKNTLFVITKNNPNLELVKQMQAERAVKTTYKHADLITIRPDTFKISGNAKIVDDRKLITVDIKGKGDEKPVKMTAGYIIKTDTVMDVSPDGKMKYRARADYVYSPPSPTGISSPIKMRIYPNQGVYPLIVINNKVATHDDFQALQPDKIDHILYLKDSSATKLYGNKASEGALLITTKDVKKL